jgi:hypothetical protein
MMYSSRKLLTELSEQNEFFDMIVDMIPSKLYIAGQSGDDFNPKNPYYRGVTKDSKESRKAAAKVAKRLKLDPTQSESTVGKKERLERTLTRENKSLPHAVTPPTAVDPTDSTSNTATNNAASASPPQSRIEALRAKLHAKIASKQGQRPSNPDQVSKRAARRQDKERRREEAVKRKKNTGGTSKTDDLKTAAAYYKMASASVVMPSEDLANLDFGRLAGLNTKQSGNYSETNKSLANLSKKKNLTKVLEDAEAKRKKLEELKKGSLEDQTRASAIQWVDTLKEADGQRVKDDPSKIKKALKRQVTKKAKSQKAWKARTQQQQVAKDDRQKIRAHNLEARKQGGAVGANLSKKAIKVDDNDGGRRLSRAGFEGKKREFLNSPKDKKDKKAQ